jgi:hypothetical protein
MITDSRVKEGTLTLGTAPGTDFSCQVTNIRVNSSYDDDGDAVETLCGDELAPGRKVGGRSLAGTFIQDWTASAGLTAYLWEHDLEDVPFEYVPNVAGPTITGTVRLEVPAESYGGDVNTRITSDFEWGMTSKPTFTPPVAADTEAATGTRGKAKANA